MARRSDSWVALLRSYTGSEKLAQVSFGAECLYLRLLAIAGDDGLAPAHPMQLLWTCFAPHASAGNVGPEHVEAWLDELESVRPRSPDEPQLGLIRRYEAEGRPFLALVSAVRWVKTGRFRPSGLPEPPWPVLPEEPAGGLVTANPGQYVGSEVVPPGAEAGSGVDPLRIHAGSSRARGLQPPTDNPQPARVRADGRARGPQPTPQPDLDDERRRRAAEAGRHAQAVLMSTGALPELPRELLDALAPYVPADLADLGASQRSEVARKVRSVVELALLGEPLPALPEEVSAALDTRPRGRTPGPPTIDEGGPSKVRPHGAAR